MHGVTKVPPKILRNVFYQLIVGRATTKALLPIQIIHDWSRSVIATAYASCYDWEHWHDYSLYYTYQAVWCKTIRDLDLH